MKNTICEHNNITPQGFLACCIDYYQLLMEDSAKCQHRRIIVQDIWARCVNCGETLYEYKQDDDNWVKASK